MATIDLKEAIRDIPDFPKPGIMFRDITTLLADPVAFEEVIDRFVEKFADARIDAILAAEARGFIFAAPLAIRLGARFVPVRKPGKLPFNTESFQYELEYGTDTLEIHVDAVGQGDRVLLIDDLLATGGTIAACVQLAEKLGAEVVGCGFVIELDFLKGRDVLAPHDVFSLVHYDSE
ncbi:MAG: adenine phosphoribosyltransferase [Planctomycetaceae bacterium]|nr:adenine phosphoribosyltransferase [Planctomycetaceae bacterium]